MLEAHPVCDQFSQNPTSRRTIRQAVRANWPRPDCSPPGVSHRGIKCANVTFRMAGDDHQSLPRDDLNNRTSCDCVVFESRPEEDHDEWLR